MSLALFAQPDDVPSDAKALWDEAAASSFFLSRWWFETIAAAGRDPGDQTSIAVLRDGDGRTCGIVPTRIVRRHAFLPWRELRSMTGIYSCYFRPLIAPASDSSAASLGAALGQEFGRLGIFHFDGFDAQWPQLPAFAQGLARVGLTVTRYSHFANWWEDLGTRSFDEYLAARDGALREIIRRRGRRLEREGRISYAIVSRPAELEDGIAVYDSVYARSWKIPEPYPAFQTTLMRNACREGVLRLGICRIDGAPVAVQLWIAWHGRATVLKLAHDEAAKSFSAGSLLTAWMIGRLMRDDAITQIDFGRGDDPYKRLWATQREQRIGILAANPRTVAGFALHTRQLLEGAAPIRWARARLARDRGGD